jgi:DMSO/TMAO reductase YedYZ heme-binding membrane subunit
VVDRVDVVAVSNLFDELTDKAGALPASKHPSPKSAFYVGLRAVLPLIFCFVLVVPGYTYFGIDHAAAELFGPNIEPAVRFYTLFRLFGLYAFTFLWGQVMFGPFMAPLGRMYGKNWYYFHRIQGVFALLLAVIHPLILYTAYYLQTSLFDPMSAAAQYVGPDYLLFVYLGITAETLLIVTVVSALLMRRPWMRKIWRYIHLLNYVIFTLALIHSYVLGTDVHQAPLHWLYVFYGLTFVMAVIYRRIYLPLMGRDNLHA